MVVDLDHMTQRDGRARGRRPDDARPRAGAAPVPDARRRAAHDRASAPARSSCRRSTGSCWPSKAFARSSTSACAAARPSRSWRSTSTRVACCAAPAAAARRSAPEALALMRLMLGGRLNEALAVPASPATHEVSTLRHAGTRAPHRAPPAHRGHVRATSAVTDGDPPAAGLQPTLCRRPTSTRSSTCASGAASCSRRPRSTAVSGRPTTTARSAR